MADRYKLESIFRVQATKALKQLFLNSVRGSVLCIPVSSANESRARIRSF